MKIDVYSVSGEKDYLVCLTETSLEQLALSDDIVGVDHLLKNYEFDDLRRFIPKLDMDEARQIIGQQGYIRLRI